MLVGMIGGLLISFFSFLLVFSRGEYCGFHPFNRILLSFTCPKSPVRAQVPYPTMLSHHLSLVYLLSLLLSLSPLTLALPPPPPPPPPPPTTHLTNLTDASSLHSYKYNYNCIPRRWYQRSPTFPACQGAIFYLPGDTEQGSFHDGRPLDRFWLPKIKTCLSCAVTVRLADEMGDPLTASWSLVRDRALGLAEQ